MRALHEIAKDINDSWKKRYYVAIPYIDAMSNLSSPNDMYGLSNGRQMIFGFLRNASSFQGEKARQIKAELKNMINENNP